MNPTQTVRALQHREGTAREVEDAVVVEEPLEIRVNGCPFSATMRTPQSDETDRFLTLGLLLAEGIISSYDDVIEVKISAHCRDFNDSLTNLADAILADEVPTTSDKWARGIISNSSCGLCGHASVEALSAQITPLTPSPLNLDLLRQLPEKMRAKQTIFSQTGGLHAAAIFNQNGELLTCFEDIGRHNATDKAIGYCLQNNQLFSADHLTLLVSGRASFEIIQKALRAQITTVAAISAASSLAVDLSKQNNLNLVGFLRERGLTVY
ncbi:formate dehydrogenase accessory sulfurtransferase FdhD [bacterium]|nr:MAG: formate dehydrogenase accessory sulfurtransferase FdhD [bacterium]